MPDEMLMEDVKNAAGGAVLSKGEHLNADNMTKLAEAGRTEVSARPLANLDKYVSMEEHKSSSGEMMIGKNETLSEDAVTKLVDAGMKEVMARLGSNIDPYVVMENYTDKSGGPIAAKGDALTEEMITKCSEAGISEIVLAPATPTEIACAQLCGLGHYRMRGYLTVQTPDEFKAWYDQQEAAVNPPPAEQTPAAADSTAIQGSPH
jgi:hypothetical protein